MKRWLVVAALLGGLAVVMGAFAAHGLRPILSERMLATFETGARYQMYHALAIGLVAFAMRGRAARLANIAAALFLTGVLLFSGSLYLLAFTGMTSLGMITPIGGLSFIAGWAALALAALKLERSE
ncbi:MAG: hypothetical protein RJB58_1141 [Pseudomonadota bacterium]|jgi:uncharacterized membrane protein YgdD (TMEM256/DUF423 family)